MLAAVGMTMLLVFTMMIFYWSNRPVPFYGPYNDPLGLVIVGFLPLGLILTCIGASIRGRFSEKNPFLTKDGEPIHSGKPWYKGSESGLYLTSCGLIVSVNEESEVTAHIGYRIVPAMGATHQDCVVKAGKEVLDFVSKRRSW